MNENLTNKTINRDGSAVLNTFINAINWNDAASLIIEWGLARESRIVCLCNVHSSVTALSDHRLSTALEKSDLVLPDGAPIAWMLRRKGYSNQERISGPDLMTKICNDLNKNGPSIFLFGTKQTTLDKLSDVLHEKYPSLLISGTLSPAYGDWSTDEESAYISSINESGAGIIFIGLGCPKQEIWMANNRQRVNGVMLGVGAAFDFHAGTVKRAPLLMQKIGLEWLHRLLRNPRRLWKRYLYTNTRFLWLAAKELLMR